MDSNKDVRQKTGSTHRMTDEEDDDTFVCDCCGVEQQKRRSDGHKNMYHRKFEEPVCGDCKRKHRRTGRWPDKQHGLGEFA